MESKITVRYLVCPQCGIIRFHVKNAAGQAVVVQVTREFEVVAVNAGERLEGYNLNYLYCLGCSWKGSIRALKRYIQ
jgi:hypothetical protein